MPALERVFRGLTKATIESGGATPEGLAVELDLKAGTMKNYFTVLHKQGRAGPLGDGRWVTLSYGNQPTDYYDYDAED